MDVSDAVRYIAGIIPHWEIGEVLDSGDCWLFGTRCPGLPPDMPQPPGNPLLLVNKTTLEYSLFTLACDDFFDRLSFASPITEIEGISLPYRYKQEG